MKQIRFDTYWRQVTLYGKQARPDLAGVHWGLNLANHNETLLDENESEQGNGRLQPAMKAKATFPEKPVHTDLAGVHRGVNLPNHNEALVRDGA